MLNSVPTTNGTVPTPSTSTGVSFVNHVGALTPPDKKSWPVLPVALTAREVPMYAEPWVARPVVKVADVTVTVVYGTEYVELTDTVHAPSLVPPVEPLIAKYTPAVKNAVTSPDILNVEVVGTSKMVYGVPLS